MSSWWGRMQETQKEKNRNSRITALLPIPAESVGICFGYEQLGNLVSILPCGALGEHEPRSTSVFILLHKSARIRFISANSWKTRDSSKPVVPRPNIPERLNIWYRVLLKAYHFQWLLEVAGLQIKTRAGGEARTDPPRCVVQHRCRVYFTLRLWRERSQIGTKNPCVRTCEGKTEPVFSHLPAEWGNIESFSVVLFDRVEKAQCFNTFDNKRQYLIKNVLCRIKCIVLFHIIPVKLIYMGIIWRVISPMCFSSRIFPLPFHVSLSLIYLKIRFFPSVILPRLFSCNGFTWFFVFFLNNLF